MHFHADCTQFSNYFQNHYSPPFNLCQQFILFSHLVQLIFGAMHTIANPFLCILATEHLSVNPHVLTIYEHVSFQNKKLQHSSLPQFFHTKSSHNSYNIYLSLYFYEDRIISRRKVELTFYSQFIHLVLILFCDNKTVCYTEVTAPAFT